MEKLTAIIPTGNEAHNIEEVLESVSFADEIIVVDSFSTDETVALAEKYSPKILQREYKNSASQKNWTIPQAQHEWILLVDADERVTPELREEILQILKNPPQEFVGYWIYRNNHFMGQKVHYSGWKNDKVIRLFRKSKCRYEKKMVHAEIIADGKVGKLKNRLYHNTYVTLDKYIEKKNRYAAWQAKDYEKKTGKISIFHVVIKPFYGFIKHYFIQSGFRDGMVGFTISYIQAYAIFMRYAKLWLLRRGRS
ncbi:MAG TPA: glycosyltransferase family 2 protein [Salinimicrobium sp.]|nr:glycosyltransferase family 2 protein [Salinimicrobium sp.]